jgi:hypothetical protein
VTDVALPCQIHLPGELPHRKLRTDLHVIKTKIHKTMELNKTVIVEIGLNILCEDSLPQR